MIVNGHKEFTERLEYICGKYADKPAITYMRDDDSKDNFTFKEIFKRVQAAREQFTRVGLRPGDRAAIVSPHTPFAVIAGFALAYANITAVLIDAALPPEEINRMLSFSDVHAVFTVPVKYEAIDKTILHDIPTFDLSQSGTEYQMFSNSSKEVLCAPTSDPDLEVISILFSSGTTASMKGIMITYTAVEKSRPMYHKVLGRDTDFSILFVLPFNHVAGYSVAFLYFLSGGSMGMLESADATKISAAFHSYNPQSFALVPRFYEIVKQRVMLNIREKGRFIECTARFLLAISHFSYKFLGFNVGKHLLKGIRSQVFGERITLLGTGASMCNAEVASFFLDLGISIWANYYATTETYVPTIVTGIFDRYPAGTEGRIDRFKGIETKIHEPDENGIGEVRIKTILIMKGYFREPELTAAAFDEDGYFKTGDLGYIDKKGYLHITGRIKEAIHMHTGKKVAPFDVDSLYGGLCPNIALASCGVPCKDGAFDEIHLFIERGGLSADGQNEVRKTIADFSAQTSTLYKISGIHFINKLPLTSVGKVKRYLLKETAVSERSTEREVSAPQKTSGGDVETIVINIVKSHADMQTVTLDSHLQYDLGFDSLTLMEICVDIEGELNTLIAENMGAVKTVRDVITLIESGSTVSRDVAYDIEDYPLPKTKKHIRRLKLFMRLSRLAWRFEVSGLENIPTNGKYILCPNHQSYLDSLWIWSAVGHKRVNLSKISCLAAEVFLSSKFMLAMLGGIPVERSGNTIPAMKRGLACIQDGYTMLIHPEGTRSRDGKMHDFKGGAAKLAIDADVPVIPVRIDGAWDIFPPHRKRPKMLHFGRRYPITISFGKPIAPDGKSVEGLTAELQTAVERLGEVK